MKQEADNGEGVFSTVFIITAYMGLIAFHIVGHQSHACWSNPVEQKCFGDGIEDAVAVAKMGEHVRWTCLFDVFAGSEIREGTAVLRCTAVLWRTTSSSISNLVPAFNFHSV